jgi:hypothetical protein
MSRKIELSVVNKKLGFPFFLFFKFQLKTPNNRQDCQENNYISYLFILKEPNKYNDENRVKV